MRKPLLAAASLVAALSLGAPATASAHREDRVERSIANIVNLVRWQHGVRPLRIDGRLARAAISHSSAMQRSGVLTHYPSLSARIPFVAHASSVIGETLAWMPRGTRRLAVRVVRAWMQSPPHRAALLDGRFRSIGVGRRGGRRGTFVTADLRG
jgi:uncharacterized protein YkwD